MDPWLSLLVGVCVVLLITGGTAFFVAQEFAYMAVDRSRLTASAARGDAAAARALGITSRTSFMLSGAQLGITVTGLLVGYVAEPLIGVALADLAGGSSTAWALGVGSIVALGFSTIVQMLFGELLPKNYAISRPDGSARWLATPTRIYLAVMKPLIWFFDKAAELFLKAMGIEPVHDVEHAATASDLEHVVELSRDSGELDDELSTMIDRIIDFPRQDVGHAMIARSRVDTLASTSTLAQARTSMSTGSSRYPVLDEGDNVVGVLHLLDVLGAPRTEGPITDLVRPALVVQELMKLPAALSLLRYEKERLACVVDEYGGFTGILTIEDLAEEIVGEITDEHDPDDLNAEPVEDDGIWIMNGDVHVDEVERALRIDLPPGEYETIAGLVIDSVGALPEQGQTVDIALPLDATALLEDETPIPLTLHVEVLEIANHVPSRLRLTLPESEPVVGESDTIEDER